ncbi:MAG: oxygenase MpaB family protein [Proteobacteria bacterium]|nr:oxygenase MpaB family protein [Pseudomonadota bacterium]
MADVDSRAGERYATAEIVAYVNRVHAGHDAGLAQAFLIPDGIPAIQLAPSEGKLVQLLLRLAGARRVVEVGTLVGYSGTHIARALPADGHLHTVELSATHAEVARANFVAAGVADRVTVHVGAGVTSCRRSSRTARSTRSSSTPTRRATSTTRDGRSPATSARAGSSWATTRTCSATSSTIRRAPTRCGRSTRWSRPRATRCASRRPTGSCSGSCDEAVVIVTRAAHEASLAELIATVDDPRGGILGPRSVAWRIGGDLSVFLGGGRAAFLQLAHPMVAFAIDQHSKTRSDIGGRFQRTFKHVFAMVFGDLDAALVAARRVHAIHARIHGTFPEAVGAWPAGTAYHANDAAALRWVHATLVDTTLVTRELLGGPLPRADRDGYVRDMNRFAALFGIPEALRPHDHAAHAAYMAAELPRLAVASCAREMGQFLIGRGGTGTQPPLGRLTEALAAAMLPPPLAAAFELRTSARLVTAALRVVGRPLGLVPPTWIAIPAHADARRRVRGQGPSALAAWTERRLFGLARAATGQ